MGLQLVMGNSDSAKIWHPLEGVWSSGRPECSILPPSGPPLRRQLQTEVALLLQGRVEWRVRRQVPGARSLCCCQIGLLPPSLTSP